jgi:hypothetical protein
LVDRPNVEIKIEIDQDEKSILVPEVVHLVDIVHGQDPQEDHLEKIVHLEVIDLQKNQRKLIILTLKKMKASVVKD